MTGTNKCGPKTSNTRSNDMGTDKKKYQVFFSPTSEASWEVSNFIEISLREKTPTHLYTVSKICQSVCLTNFDLNYYWIGKIDNWMIFIFFKSDTC